MDPSFQQKIKIIKMDENLYEFDDPTVNFGLNKKKFSSLRKFYDTVIEPYELKFKTPVILKNSHRFKHYTFACSQKDCPFRIMLSSTSTTTGSFAVGNDSRVHIQEPGMELEKTGGKEIIITNNVISNHNSTGLVEGKEVLQNININGGDDDDDVSGKGNLKSDSIFEGDGIQVRLENSYEHNKDKQDDDGEGEEQQQQGEDSDKDEDSDGTKKYGPYSVTKILLDHNHSVQSNVNSLEALKEYILVKIPKILSQDLNFDELLKDVYIASLERENGVTNQHPYQNIPNNSYMKGVSISDSHILGNNKNNTNTITTTTSTTTTTNNDNTSNTNYMGNTKENKNLFLDDNKFKVSAYLQESGLFKILSTRYHLKPEDILGDKTFVRNISRRLTTYKSRFFNKLKKESKNLETGLVPSQMDNRQFNATMSIEKENNNNNNNNNNGNITSNNSSKNKKAASKNRQSDNTKTGPTKTIGNNGYNHEKSVQSSDSKNNIDDTAYEVTLVGGPIIATTTAFDSGNKSSDLKGENYGLIDESNKKKKNKRKRSDSASSNHNNSSSSNEFPKKKYLKNKNKNNTQQLSTGKIDTDLLLDDASMIDEQLTGENIDSTGNLDLDLNTGNTSPEINFSKDEEEAIALLRAHNETFKKKRGKSSNATSSSKSSRHKTNSKHVLDAAATAVAAVAAVEAVAMNSGLNLNHHHHHTENDEDGHDHMGTHGLDSDVDKEFENVVAQMALLESQANARAKNEDTDHLDLRDLSHVHVHNNEDNKDVDHIVRSEANIQP